MTDQFRPVYTAFFFAWILLVSCKPTRNFSALELSQSTLLAIDSACMTQLEKSHFPGLAVSIAHTGQRLWSRGYGYADIEQSIPIDPEEHLFRIGSISKTVTASALGWLMEKKDIDIDAPISLYYEHCPPDKSALTLRQIGGHLAGIRHYKGLEFLSAIAYDDVVAPLDVFIQDTLLHPPGTAYHYTTYGWTLISAVMELAIRKPFLDIIRDEVSVSLRLNELKADHRDSMHYNRVVFYDWKEGHQISPAVNNSNKWAGGGMLCTADDLARYGFAHVGPGYLSAATLQTLTTPQTLSDGKKTNYAIGFSTGTDRQGRRWYGHSGGSAGGTSMLLIYPEEELVIVTLVNLSGARMEELAWRIADVVLQNEK